MSEAVLSESDKSAAVERVRPTRRQLAAVVAGNALEFYDFGTYAFFAVHIGQTFFPSESASASLLASLATFGVGFVTRPLGALVLGRLGDRLGRRPAMVLCFALMGVSSAGVALTPSYAAIGVIAPALVIFWRLLQGFALGGEMGPSTSFLLEVAPPRWRGLWVSFQYMGQAAAALFAGLVGVILANVLGEEGMRDVGWRVALLFGVLVVPIGLALRRDLPETLPAAVSGEAKSDRLPWRLAVLGIVIVAAGTTVSYVLKYLTSYAIVTLHMPTKVALMGPVIGGSLGLFTYPFAAALSDRIGRKPVMLVPWLFLVVAILPVFSLLSSYPTPAMLYSSIVVLGGLGSFGAVAILIAITEMMPPRVRSGGLALTYALAISIFGGTAQFNVAWLTSVTQSPLAPAWYMMAGVSIGLLAVLAMPETAPARLPRPSA